MGDGFKFMDPLGANNTLTYNTDNGSKKFEINKLEKTLAANKIFPQDKLQSYDKFSRYGYISLYSNEQVCREYLFFTKPDLNIFGDGKTTSYDYNSCELNKDLASIPFFIDACGRNKDALLQLQYSVKNHYGIKNPFMYLLSNYVTSKLDLPSLSAESKESTANIMGTTIQYRSHSYKSDNGYDFTLSFNDTSTLE